MEIYLASPEADILGISPAGVGHHMSTNSSGQNKLLIDEWKAEAAWWSFSFWPNQQNEHLQ